MVILMIDGAKYEIVKNEEGVHGARSCIPMQICRMNSSINSVAVIKKNYYINNNNTFFFFLKAGMYFSQCVILCVSLSDQTLSTKLKTLGLKGRNSHTFTYIFHFIDAS